MAIIEADNPEIGAELRRLEKLVEEGGGGMHSDVVLYADCHGLGVRTREPMPRGKEIIRLSRKILLPEDYYNIRVEKGAFSVNFENNAGFLPLQKELTDCMIRLYNFTDKVGFQKKVSFCCPSCTYPDLTDHLFRGRHISDLMLKWRPRLEDPSLSEDTLNDFITETFLKTRHLGYEDKIRASNISILMPVIDFMNHHWEGAAFNVGLGVRPGDLAVMSSQPVPESTDCYAFYGIMDAFDTLVRYDFIDEGAPVVRSIPLELEAPGLGTIKIDSQTGANNRKKLEGKLADMSRFIPVMTVDRKKRTLSASHVMIPVKGSRRALRRALYILLTNLAGQEIETAVWKSWVREAEATILEKNRLYYEELAKLSERSIREKGPDEGLDRISALAALQLEKLEGYAAPQEAAA
ncbi:MAG: hypothetical protein R3D66_00075 [Alphaproteobacteria bacterium]